MSWKQHRFTADIVEDPRLFEVGDFETVQGDAQVARLETLLLTKIATLVSRCSEKDLYDLIWLFDRFQLDWPQLIELGQQLDGGLNGESLLLSLSGSTLRADACDFGLDGKPPRTEIYKNVSDFQKSMTRSLSVFLHSGKQDVELGKLARQIRKWTNA